MPLSLFCRQIAPPALLGFPPAICVEVATMRRFPVSESPRRFPFPPGSGCGRKHLAERLSQGTSKNSGFGFRGTGSR